MQNVEKYDLIAPWYDLLYGRVSDVELSDYLSAMLLRAPGRVLEIGSGTGRLSICLAQHGFDVVGCELSNRMWQRSIDRFRALSIAERRRLVLLNLSFIGYPLSGDSFDYVIAPFNVLNEVDGGRSLVTLLARGRRKLCSSGRLLGHVIGIDVGCIPSHDPLLVRRRFSSGHCRVNDSLGAYSAVEEDWLTRSPRVLERRVRIVQGPYSKGDRLLEWSVTRSVWSREFLKRSIRAAGFARAALRDSAWSSEDDGWEVVVKSQEDDEIAWILYHEDKHEITDIHITALDEEELVMIRVSGHLDELLEEAIEDICKKYKKKLSA